MTADGIRIGIDIGGTFTDLEILDERSGQLHSLKTPTTPEDPSAGLFIGIAEAGRRFGFGVKDIRLLLHGTTIATNAVLERRLARGVLITTAGFRDVLEIGRHARRDIYGLRPRRPQPLIPRARRIGIAERIGGDGRVELALDEAAIAASIEHVRGLQAEAVAIVLLNAHVTPDHEQMLRARLATAWPDLPVAISSEISPEIREYERSSTTVLNALLMPVVGAYLDNLARRLRAEGLEAPLLLVQSNGGVCSAAMARAEPVRLLLSGPSGGAAAARLLARHLGRPHLVGIDMGGTSFDVSVLRDGEISTTMEGEIDDLPVRLPMVEIRTIGAGGGSIAALAAGERLVIGPESAGARPGPACYRCGGTLPTVTDANLLLGRLDAGFFLGGAMELDMAAARQAMSTRIAIPLALSVEAAAAGILSLTHASMAHAIRLSLFERGLDPRDFSLLSFGGAGGLHAIEVAEELGIREVIFPADASTFSAFGILHSDIKHDLAQSRLMPADTAHLPESAAIAADLHRRGAALLAADGIAPEDAECRLAADLRYRGQAFELTVPWDAPGLTEIGLARLIGAFHEQHHRRFSYANPHDLVEIVTLRLAAIGRLRVRAAERPAARHAPPAARGRAVWSAGGWREIAVYHRVALTAEITGPALIEEDYTSVFITSGWRCAPAAAGALIASREEP